MLRRIESSRRRFQDYRDRLRKKEVLQPELARGDTVVVVSHGNALRVLVHLVTGMPLEEAAKLAVPTATNAANITVTNTAANGVGENAGISAFVQTGGAGSNASVTNTGIVIDNSGLGIQAENDGAGKATVLNNGPVTSTGADGIEAFT